MTHNIKTVTSVLHCEGADFTCTVEMQNGGEMRLSGSRAISMFLSMLDIFEIDEFDDEQEELVH